MIVTDNYIISDDVKTIELEGGKEEEFKKEILINGTKVAQEVEDIVKEVLGKDIYVVLLTNTPMQRKLYLLWGFLLEKISLHNGPCKTI